MARLAVKCAGILCGEKYEFVAKIQVNGRDVYTSARVFIIDDNAPLTLSSPEFALIQHFGEIFPRKELPFRFWEEEITGKRVTERAFTVQPPQPALQKWWVNYG